MKTGGRAVKHILPLCSTGTGRHGPVPIALLVQLQPIELPQFRHL